MAATRKRKTSADRAALPSSITSDADLATHLAALVDRQPVFRRVLAIAGDVPLRKLDPGFRGLCWIVIGQQISAAAGRAIFERAETTLGPLSPACVSAADDASMKSAGLSAPKIRTLRTVAEAVRAGDLDVDGLTALEAEDAIAHLSTVKGIGRWTAEVYLLFALGHADVFPAGDLALKEGVRMAFELDERPTEKHLVARAEDWRPHRSAAARLLWAYYGTIKRGGVPV